MQLRRPRTLIIGAGIGGLSAALRLAARGHDVTIFERHDQPGGKMRTVPSSAGPIDAGPTVLTMRHVFDELFEAAGERLDDHVTLERQNILARHWWGDGSTLDLYADHAANMDAIRALSGSRDAEKFQRFCRDARVLFETFETPMMQANPPRRSLLVRSVLQNPKALRAMAPLRSLAARLAREFDDVRLRQLFGRYATYVGGSPYRSPALLALIWHAEASGVWTVAGGMQALSRAILRCIEKLGGRIEYSAKVEEICRAGTDEHSFWLADGRIVTGDNIVFNGDPNALHSGLLGHSAKSVCKCSAVSPRSLSAYVWSFAASAQGRPLVHHNVFFGDHPESEFRDLEAGLMPTDPTLYICAQDRDDTASAPQKPERFEIIMNAPPAVPAPDKEFEQCQTRVFQRLSKMGLILDPWPGPDQLTTPRQFAELFPGSQGALYGRSPHGLTAALKRPTTRTAIKGLYLAGGGTHPGAGVPMAALSGRHAAEAILQDQISTSTSRPMAMRGGMSTGSAPINSKPYQS